MLNGMKNNYNKDSLWDYLYYVGGGDTQQWGWQIRVQNSEILGIGIQKSRILETSGNQIRKMGDWGPSNQKYGELRPEIRDKGAVR